MFLGIAARTPVKVLLDTNVFPEVDAGRKAARKGRAPHLNRSARSAHQHNHSLEIALKQNRFHAKGLTNARIADAINLLGARILPVLLKHIDTLYALPLHHQDPFDRMLIAQGISEKAIVLSSDERFPLYQPAGLQLRWN
jgi:PIN domain nuclease of toxin-antitoxin system